MAEHDPPKRTPAGQRGDDFRKIMGIGAKYERRLHDAGILTYQDLAERSPQQIADVAGVSAALVASQDWIGQARRLAGPLPSPPSSEPSQHYESFHIELLLGVDNSVRRTKVHHHQSDTDFTWPGWDEDHLLALLREHIPLAAYTQPAEAVHPQSSAAPPATRLQTAAPSRTQPETASTPISLPPSALHVEELAPIREGERTYTWGRGEPASVRLALRVDPAKTLSAAALDFSAEITASSKLGDSRRWPLETMQGAIRVGEPLSVDLTGPPLPRGLYRLEATVLIYPTDHAPDAQPIHSRSVLGELIQITDDVLVRTAPAPT